MNVLLIGGTGVISTGITRQLADSRHSVTCFTRGNTAVKFSESVPFIHGDRNNGADLEAARDSVEPDCVIDMVCFEPEQATQAVDVFTDTVEQYVFCSTIDVYHRPLATNPVQEDAPRTPSVTEYSASKAACEDVFLKADEEDDLAATVIRPWSTYGEGGPVFHTLGSGTYFLDRIREGKPVILHGDGQGIWGSSHRSDVARAFVNAVGERTAYGEVYHVTPEEIFTWDQYYETVAEAMDAPAPDTVYIPTDVLVEVVPDRTEMLVDHFQYSHLFDNSKAKRDLDFEYTVPFRDGIERTITWLDENDEIDPWNAYDDGTIISNWRDTVREFTEGSSTLA